MELSSSLSREEQEELARSNKKVKDVSYAGFQGGLDSGSSSPSYGQGSWSRAPYPSRISLLVKYLVLSPRPLILVIVWKTMKTQMRK